MTTTNTQQLSMAQLQARIAELEKQNAELAAKNNQPRDITFKISEETGAVSVYGLNARFPITLYAEQWPRLIEKIPDLQAFMAKNEKFLSLKSDDEATAKGKHVARLAETQGIVSHPKNNKQTA